MTASRQETKRRFERFAERLDSLGMRIGEVQRTVETFGEMLANVNERLKELERKERTRGPEAGDRWAK